MIASLDNAFLAAPLPSPHTTHPPPPVLATCFLSTGFGDLFSVKEDGEILNAKKAAFLASKVMQAWVVEKLEDIIDKNKKVKHAKLSGTCCVWLLLGGWVRAGGQGV